MERGRERERVISVRAKARVYKDVLIPSIIYRSEIQALNAFERSRLDVLKEHVWLKD